MKRIFKVFALVMVVGILAVVFAGTVSASDGGPLGLNPRAGDGVPDGSSLESPNGPNGTCDDCVYDSCKLNLYEEPGPHRP